MTLTILIWLPLAIGLVASQLPGRWPGYFSSVASLAPVGIAIDYLVRFHAGQSGLQFVTDKVWISSLGVHYKLGLSGLNVTLILLTTVLFTASIVWSAGQGVSRQKTYFLLFGLAESGVLGAFCVQDVLLFVGFFDLMLIPFYFLTAIWGTGNRMHATITMIIYTAVGSFLMLAGAVAVGVISAADHHTALNFTFTALEHNPVGRGSAEWIFLCFAAAFLIKMPVAPFHGWLPEVYKSLPIPAVAVFSGVLSKVAAYGFLAIVLPIFPGASKHFQLVMMIISVGAILWATMMAFTTRDARLVIAYSSVAQMAFITLGIFSLKTEGGQGALLQMINHGVVTAASFFVLAAVAARCGGSESLDDMSGAAFKAPVLATLFLIVAMATLGMPGSGNFVGEFLILLGTFDSKLPLAIIGSLGMIGAAVYALRLFIGAMHNRTREKVHSREVLGREAVAIVPLVLVILALAFFPEFGLEHSNNSVKSSIAAAAASTPNDAIAMAPRRIYTYGARKSSGGSK
jgi:NADH-quinone oxidoreductase subunit M